MADVKWIKITTDIFDDEKILLIESLPDAYAIITVWFKLLCLAGKQNNSGVFMMGKIAYTDKMLATIFRMKETTVTMALQTFEQFGMVEIIDGVITIPNWGKHQNLDQLESKKEYMRNYMRDYREKQKMLTCKTNSKANVSEADKEADKEEDKERDKDNNRRTRTPKSKYGEFQRVLLTDAEYEKLVQDYGRAQTGKAIHFLDEYIEEKGYKSKSHNLAIRRWVMDAVKEREAPQKGKRKEMVPKWMEDTNPSSERIKKNNDWLDDFLTTQEAAEKKAALDERVERLKESLAR